jgi:hypothetical protein
VEDEIAEDILKGVFHPGDVIKVVRKNDEKLELLHGKAKAKKAALVEEDELELTIA